MFQFRLLMSVVPQNEETQEIFGSFTITIFPLVSTEGLVLSKSGRTRLKSCQDEEDPFLLETFYSLNRPSTFWEPVINAFSKRNSLFFVIL